MARRRRAEKLCGMRKTIIAMATAAAVGLTAVPAQAAALPPPNDKLLTEAIAGLPTAEATGALVRITGSAGEWHGRSGVYDIRKGGEVRPDGRFRIGSITKVFTAVLVLQLAQEHRIDLDQPVQRYLPGVIPGNFKPIPVRTLLDHTSGLPHVDIPEAEDPQWVYDHRFDAWTPRQVLDTATRHEPIFDPGTKQMYSNTSYLVAGLLAEKVTGRSYADLVQDRIARPLHLCETYYPGNDPRLPNASARGYMEIDGQLLDSTEMNQSIPWAAGGMISTAEEVDRFMTALLQGRLLSPEMNNRLFTVPPPEVRMLDGKPAEYSQGLQTSTVNGITVWGKTGSRYGYSAGMFATRDQARKLVYSINTTDKSAQGQPMIVLRLADAVTR
jgi:D-alanyl-D-alanine carboxypeptidase